MSRPSPEGDPLRIPSTFGTVYSLWQSLCNLRRLEIKALIRTFAYLNIRKMKSSLKIILALLASALLLASCNKDTFGTYTYKNIYVSTTGIADSTSLVQIVDYVKSFEFFTKEHSYEGTYSDTYTKAIDDFVLNVEKLDDEFIESRLGPGENFGIYCIQTSSGGYVAYKMWVDQTDTTEE